TASAALRPDALVDRFAEFDPARDLVRREIARAVIDDLLGAALLLRDDARDDHRARHRIGDDARLRGLDLRERLEAALDLAECDALAIDLDDIVFAAGQHEPAGLVDLAEIAGAQPARLVDRADRDHAARPRALLALVLVIERADRLRRQRLALDPDQPFLRG